MNDLPPAVAERIGFLLAKAHQAVLARVGGPLEEGKLTPKHFGCLSVISDEGPLSQHELGKRMRVDRTTIVALVDDLESEGLVERRRNPEDRRAYALVVSLAGADWLERAAKAVREAERDFLAPLSATERKQLIELLQRLVAR